MLTGRFEFGRVTLLGSVQLSAVAAVGAVRSLSDLVQNWSVRALGCPLPGVFGTVCEESVRSLDIEASLVNRSLESSWESIHVKAGERSLAHVRPVAELKHL